MTRNGASHMARRLCMQVIAPLLRVLVVMHRQHILHRDIKPENLFLTRRWAMVLGDFGLAIRCDEELPFTRSGHAGLHGARRSALSCVPESPLGRAAVGPYMIPHRA